MTSNDDDLSSNDKYNDLAEVPLAGYTDRLSARPGDTVKFYLSATTARTANNGETPPLQQKVKVRASLTSSICADPNPKGQGIIEKDASMYFEERTIGIRHQTIPRGSFAQTRSNLKVSSSIFKDLRKIKIELWFYPTLIAAKTTRSSTVKKPSLRVVDQNVWSWGDGFRLDLLSTGHLKLLYNAKKDCEQPQLQVVTCTSSQPLKQKRWYCITSTLELSADDKHLSCHLTIEEKDDRHDNVLSTSSSFKSESNLTDDNGLNAFLVSIDASFALATGGSLNGRLEDPEIKIETEKDGELLFATWDTSYYNSNIDETLENYIDPWNIPCNDGLLVAGTQTNAKSNSNNHSLVLHHHPTRGVKGRRWDGTEFCWTKCPKHYGAIHFHDDDIYDFQWKSDMAWKVPSDIPSGIYIMRFITTTTDDTTITGEEEHEEALPIFICAPKIPVSMSSSEGETTKHVTTSATKRNKLVLLIPTFTYVVYGNHARPDFEKDLWLARTQQSSPGAYPFNPSLFPAYGHSAYDFHSDQTGIHFASHLRPLFNLRPGYITFSRVGGYNDEDQETQQNSNDAFCSGLRHFPADSHIVSWLHHFGFDFDVITDHELHREGAAALTQYSTLLTCTHPEYHTPQSLDALQKYRDVQGGNLIYLGGNGFYWKIGASKETPAKSKDDDTNGSDDDDNDTLSSCKLLEIRRSEGGVRTWAAEAGEYYNLLDGMYGGLWRNSGRPPSKLAGIGFAAQGSFIGKPYHRICWDRPDITDWVFRGISDQDAAVLGDFGFSGDGAAGYELDRIDPTEELFRDGEVVILAQADTKADSRYALVPEEVLTPWTNLAGTSNEDAKRADMVYFRVPKSGGQVFSVGSITFCGCLPFNNFENVVSLLIKNVIDHFLEEEE
jgi:N,N-dimethylformamidase